MKRVTSLPLTAFGRVCPKCVGTGVVWGGPYGLIALGGCPHCDGWGYELKERPHPGPGPVPLPEEED
jgi:hypothetical protein